MNFSPQFGQLKQLLLENRNHKKIHTTQEIAIGVGALKALPAYLRESSEKAEKTPLLLIADENTQVAAGQELLESLRSAGFSAEAWVMAPDEGEDHLVASEAKVEALLEQLKKKPQKVLAVGSGTVNDLSKYATFQLGQEYIAVPTAASMNGYTSTIAAILVGGVKRTLPAGQPEAIFSDISLLEKAPDIMNKSGFGDLLSKPVSQGDWILSHYIRGVPYDSRPGDILEALFQRLLGHAEDIANAKPEALQVLMEAILVSGFSMAIAGSSAPASGGEHLISHYWDMEQLDAKKPLLALHGVQVGIATRLSAGIFEGLMALDVKGLDMKALAAKKPGFDDKAFLLRHGGLSTSVQDEIREQYLAKQRFGKALLEELLHVQAHWDEIRAHLKRVLMPRERLSRALREAGCKDKPSEIACDLERAERTFLSARDMRSRYVAFDLADDLQVFKPMAREILSAVEGQIP